MLDARAVAKEATHRPPSWPRSSTGLALALLVTLATSARAATGAEWLASTDGPNPTVTAKSGIGTAQAAAQAKITSDALQTFCADQAGQGDSAQARSAIDACVKQQKGELGKTYSVRADCTVGRLQPLDGKSYVLDGLWDNSDIGGGRTRWKGPDGVVVGRDNASGGLALSQQWEVLCPGRVSASTLSKARALGPSTAAGGAVAQAAPQSVCGGDPSCTEVNGFAMSMVEFRASLQGYYKILTVTLRFRNKLGRPMVLGYVQGSGGATDDRGNRYAVKDAEVRGIGLIAGRPDDKFVLAPGQTGDARFTLVWAGQQLFGNTFDLDLTVREIIPAGNGQSTLGPEYPLQIVGLVDGAKAAAPVAQAPEVAPSSSSPPPGPSSGGGQTRAPPPSTGQAPTGGTQTAPATIASPFGAAPTAGGTTGGAHCAAGASCYDAGAFSVAVVQTIPVQSGKNQMVRFAIRVKNQTAQLLVLAYKAGTNAAVDERGNAFVWGRPGTHDGSIQGIGMIEGARIDPQFQSALAPPAMRRSRSAATTRRGLRAGASPSTRCWSSCNPRPEGSGRRSASTRFTCPGQGRRPCQRWGRTRPTTTSRRPATCSRVSSEGSDLAVEGDHPEQEEEAERDQHVPPGVELRVRQAVRRERDAHPGAGLEVHEPQGDGGRVRGQSEGEPPAHGSILGTERELGDPPEAKESPAPRS